jgi:cytochrome c oxidase subunit 2
MWFQNAASPLIEYLIFFHDTTILLITIIGLGSLWFLSYTFFNKPSHRFLTDNQGIEFWWTLIPIIVLLSLAIPSLRLLYITDESGGCNLTLKVIGHQWYWSYELSDFRNIEFDSYIIRRFYRLLDVDHRVILPIDTPIRVLISAADVLHCWTVPVFGVKADAVPGRLNQVNIFIKRCGLFFGQCSEICGSNHSFIPIAIERVPIKHFTNLV